MVWQRPRQNKSNCQPCQHFHSDIAPSPMDTAQVGWAGGQCPVALLEVELVPRLLSRAPRRPRGVPYPTKHWGLKNTGTASFSVSKPKDSPSEHLQCPLSNTTYSITAQRASASVGAKPKSQKLHRGPHERCQGDLHCRAP